MCLTYWQNSDRHLLTDKKVWLTDRLTYQLINNCDITNSISSLGKPFKNEIQQPNNYKKAFDCVWKNLKNINNLMLRQPWTGGRRALDLFKDKVVHRMLAHMLRPITFNKFIAWLKIIWRRTWATNCSERPAKDNTRHGRRLWRHVLP